MSFVKPVGTFLTVGALLFAAQPVLAEQKGVELGAGITYFLFEDGFDVKDDLGYRVFGGYRFNDRWGLELVYDGVETETDSLGLDFSVDQLYINALYHFNVDSSWQPYISLGWGETEFELLNFKNKTTATNLGFGVKWYMTDNWVLRPSANYFVDTEFDDNHATVGLTLSYVFGGGSKPAKAAAPVAAAVADSDKDGVADTYDKCLATPPGVEVDSKGCPLDSDSDGVFDYEDACADTDTRLSVDTKGCPIALKETISIDLSVKFDSNSDVVKPQYYAEIQKVADFLSEYNNTAVEIEGHTDTSGSAAYNKSLSQRRADSVARVLTSQMGIASRRVTSVGYGEERPIADESTPEGRLANRRVVAKVSAVVETLQTK